MVLHIGLAQTNTSYEVMNAGCEENQLFPHQSWRSAIFPILAVYLFQMPI